MGAYHEPVQPYLIEPKMVQLLIDYKESKETIKNNTEMFLSVMRGSTVLSLIPNEDETCAFLGVDEFDEFFMTLMKNSFDTEDNKRLLNEPALSSAIYLEFLRRKYGVVGYFDDLGTASIADECFYDIVDYMYFGKKGSFNEFVSYLKVLAYRKKSAKIEVVYIRKLFFI